MSEPAAIIVKNQLSELEGVSHAVEAFGATHNLPAKLIFDVNLALDEVLTNVISYAYPDGGAHEIAVRLSLTAEHFVIEVEDDGQAFDPLALTLPAMDTPLEQRAIGGLGIHLVRRVMDQLEYRREANKNVLVMKKTIR